MKKQSNINIESFDISDGRADFKEKVKYSWHNDMRFPVFPTSWTDVIRTDGNYLRHVNYPKIAIELITEGEILYTDEETCHRATKGSIFIIVPHSNVKMVNANPQTPRRKLALIASGNAPGLICDTLGFDGDKLLKLDHPELIEKQMRHIAELIKNNADHQTAAVEFYDLLLTLSLEYNRKKSVLPQDMSDLKKYICSNLNGDLSSESLSRFAGISESTLRRRVKRYFSCTPVNLVNNIRLEQAALKLRNSAMSIKEIALGCGFSTPLYFSTLFKSAFGTTPGKYRRDYNPNPEVPIKYLS